jgi:hypothetical protein
MIPQSIHDDEKGNARTQPKSGELGIQVGVSDRRNVRFSSAIQECRQVAVVQNTGYVPDIPRTLC